MRCGNEELSFDEVFHRCLEGVAKQKGRRILRISEPFAWVVETQMGVEQTPELTQILKRAISRCVGEELGVEHLPKKWVTRALRGSGVNGSLSAMH